MKEDAQVTIFLGRTAEGFNKFLTEKNLKIIAPEILAHFVMDAIVAYEIKNLEASNNLVQEILYLVGVEDAETAVEVTRQFGRLCDTYRTVLQSITGKENVMEKGL